MVIEDIERHKHNYKLFVMFLKKRGLYMKFKKIMFINRNIMPIDLFVIMNQNPIHNIFYYYTPNGHLVDKKWSAVFSYVPFLGCHWTDENLEAKKMNVLTKEWSNYLSENNFDKK